MIIRWRACSREMPICWGPRAAAGAFNLVKHYPGLVDSDDATDLVHGELYRLRQPLALLRVLDEYEGCSEGFAEPTEFVRQLRTVVCADGVASEVWVYLYNRPVEQLPRIASGRFLEH